MMRTFANLFLFFFVVDGALSLVDELLGVAFGIDGLAPLRTLNALATLVLALPMFVALGFDRRLPKRLFLPLLAFLLWCTAGCWPLAGTLEPGLLGLLAALLQLLLGAAALGYQRLRSGTSVQLTEEDFRGPAFSLVNTFVYFGVNLFLFPLVLGFLLLATVSQQLDAQTAGFMRVSPTGLYMKERIYRHDDKEIRLTGMIHIGESDYFRDLATSIDTRHTIVLAEGVSDREGLLTTRFDYGDLGSLLGLSTQQELEFPARQVTIDELETHAWNDKDLELPHLARADVDLSSFDPRTVAFLNVLGRLISGEGSFNDNYAAYSAWMEKHMSPELYAVILGDILDKRNDTLLGHLSNALQHYDTVVIPWGAMHMPAIEAAVLAQGFTLVAEQERRSLDFARLPFADMARRLGTSDRLLPAE